MGCCDLWFALQLFINNEWVDAKKGEKMPVIDPRTGETVFEVAKASDEDVDAAIKAARKAFDEGPWPKMGGKVRGRKGRKDGPTQVTTLRSDLPHCNSWVCTCTWPVDVQAC